MLGGRVIDPPHYLTSAEARVVIDAEARLAGIRFQKHLPTLKKIALPVTSYKLSWKERANQAGSLPAVPTTTTGSLTFDGGDPHRHIAYKFISYADLNAWAIPASKSDSAVAHHDFLGTARQLQQSLSQVRVIGDFAVFYEPVGHYTGDVDAPTATLEDATLVPLSTLELLDGTKIKYALATGAITVTGAHTLTLQVGSDAATIDGKAMTLPTAVTLRWETPYLPLQPLITQLGGTLSWEAARNRALIYDPVSRITYASEVRLLPAWNAGGPHTVAYTGVDYFDHAEIDKELAREALRQQVRAFIAWLKDQGELK